jgi:hypothetical protein
MQKTIIKEVGRLAMRQEGEWWNAYYAKPNTMMGALMLGSIRMRFVLVPERKNAFLDLMREAVGDIIEEATGERPSWSGERSAPEIERAGNA